MRMLPVAALASQSCSCRTLRAPRSEAPLPQVLHTVLQALSWPPQALQKSQERAGGQAASEHLQDELGPHTNAWLPSKYPVSGDRGGGVGCFYLMSLNSVQFQEMLGVSALTTRKGNNLYWGPTMDQAPY
uniref:Uncharacterized protein n=1 Tax=Pipistrellus kuhlii TaxID=59472 RepID=A0A7J7WZW9_PIPKU|nr:hypothetical protein mPipKuh1_010726 [Pipistrellus kuhlii]